MPDTLTSGTRTLAALAEELSAYGPPVVIYCAAHSGSGFLARVLSDFGFFIGSNRNGQEDSLDLYKLLEYSVGIHFPDYARLMREGDPALAPLVRRVFRDHLSGWTPGTRWGWKLPETGYMLPIIEELFPTARYIHLVRDGRDVALSPFIAPNTPFLRKIYFGSADITAWQGIPLTGRAYRANMSLFNAAHWVTNVTFGRAAGAKAGARCIEVRYESLVGDFNRTVQEIGAFIGASLPAAAAQRLSAQVTASRIGKWKALPRRELQEMYYVLQPTLSSFGYDDEPVAPLQPARPWWRRLLWARPRLLDNLKARREARRHP